MNIFELILKHSGFKSTSENEYEICEDGPNDYYVHVTFDGDDVIIYVQWTDSSGEWQSKHFERENDNVGLMEEIYDYVAMEGNNEKLNKKILEIMEKQNMP